MITKQPLQFEEDPPKTLESGEEHDVLLVNIDGYEGPLDILLEMARKQKVDLLQISILQLVRQYLSFIDRARVLRLDLAAEYLVMAAWLAYLKSRLLLPDDEEDEDGEGDGETMAAALTYQLKRLEAMQNMAEQLQNKPQLHAQIFPRGQQQGRDIRVQKSWDAGLYDLLSAYGDIHRRVDNTADYKPADFHLMQAEEAYSRLTDMLGHLPRKGKASVWATLESFLPETNPDPLYARSSLAAMLLAGLEMAKQGEMEIRQEGLFRPIYLRQISD